MKYFSHLNLLYVRATRAIVNHAPIGEYHLRFFPNEDFSCPCGNYLIETRHHILYKYRRFDNYWKSEMRHYRSFCVLFDIQQECILFWRKYSGASITFVIASIFSPFLFFSLSLSFSFFSLLLLFFPFSFTCCSVLCNIVTK